jgi:hypothetical protein
MKTLFLFATLLCSIAVSYNLKAQNTHVLGVFPTIDHSGKFGKASEYGLYYFLAAPLTELTSNNSVKMPNALLFYLEQSYTYHFSDHISGTGSYVYQEENAFRVNTIRENRIYLQLAYAYSNDNNHFKHRLRHDSRFFTDQFKHRLRYQFSFKHEWESGNYFTFGQEFFFELTKNSSKTYNENWANAAYGIQLNERNFLELGVLCVSWNTGGSNWFNQWYFQPTWVSKLNFKN